MLHERSRVESEAALEIYRLLDGVTMSGRTVTGYTFQGRCQVSSADFGLGMLRPQGPDSHLQDGPVFPGGPAPAAAVPRRNGGLAPGMQGM
ncbi:hypothetical protein GCM10009837_68710 [Streptomyces durmitorensis]